jgi:uncharacterized protein YecE (DUF72 family)
MEDPRQIRLFEASARKIAPPEEGLYLGTSGWSYADWEGTVYPLGTSPGSRLAEYVKHFATVEIDSTFYGTPKVSTVERWRQIAPEGFLYAAKFPREITHEKSLVDCEGAAETFVRTMSFLGEKLGPLLLQLPPGFTVEGTDALDTFLRGLFPGPSYAVEVRHRSWLGSGLLDLLRERGVALTLVDYPGMPRIEEATASFAYIRWLGDRREFPSGHTHPKKNRTEDLSYWSKVVDRFREEGKTVFAYATDHYQNHAPSTVDEFLKIRRREQS